MVVGSGLVEPCRYSSVCGDLISFPCRTSSACPVDRRVADAQGGGGGSSAVLVVVGAPSTSDRFDMSLDVVGYGGDGGEETSDAKEEEGAGAGGLGGSMGGSSEGLVVLTFPFSILFLSFFIQYGVPSFSM